MNDHPSPARPGLTDAELAGHPWDIAEASVYLAAPSGKFVTGETLTVNGGGQLWGEAWTTGRPEYHGVAIKRRPKVGTADSRSHSS